MSRFKTKMGLALLLAALLAACGNNPVAPDWQVNSFGALNSFTSAYLNGDTQVADIEFARAKDAVASTARPDLVARVELVRCAAQVASLDFESCAPARAGVSAADLADMAAPERAYADYLGGRWQSLDVSRVVLLPEAHRRLVTARDDGSRVATLVATSDPLARLIGAGVLFRQGVLPPAGVVLAVNAASDQGWRRPLLAWLGVQLKLADAANDAQARAQIQRRIDLAAGRP
jgi:hypothetical protein